MSQIGSRQRSRTAGSSSDMKRPKSTPRKFADKIKAIQQRGEEDFRHFNESMKIITQMQEARVKISSSHGGSMPVLPQTEGGIPSQDMYGDHIFLHNRGQPATSYAQPTSHSSTVVTGNGIHMYMPQLESPVVELNHHIPQTTDSTLLKPNGYSTTPVSSPAQPLSPGKTQLERLRSSNSVFTRHKSDPDLHQSVLQEELSNQMHVNTAATYPAMSLANMLHSHNSQQLSMSMNAQTFHVNKSAATSGYHHHPMKTTKKNVPKKPNSTIIPTSSHDHQSPSLGGEPVNSPLQISLTKGVTLSSSLPDLTQAVFNSGLPTPLDADDSSNDSITTNAKPTSIQDFESSLPTRQIPQSQPKKYQQKFDASDHMYSYTLQPSPLANARKPTRSVTVSSFTDLPELNDTEVSMNVNDDSILLGNLDFYRMPQNTQNMYQNQPPPPAIMTEPFPISTTSAASTSRVNYHLPAGRSVSTGAAPKPYHHLGNSMAAPEQPSVSNYGSNLPLGYMTPNPVDPSQHPPQSHQKASQIQQPLISSNPRNFMNVQPPFSFTTDNIPSSTSSSLKRYPPSYYEHQMRIQPPTTVIQERINTITLNTDLPRSWSEENLQAPKDKGSPTQGPFMGNMAGASSVPCVLVDPTEEVMIQVLHQGAMSPHSPSESTSTELETPPASIRLDMPHPVFSGFFNHEWPSELGRKESLGGQYRSLTDLTLHMDTVDPPSCSQRPPQGQNLSHQLSLPSIDDIDALNLIMGGEDPFLDRIPQDMQFGDLLNENVNFQSMDS